MTDLMGLIDVHWNIGINNFVIISNGVWFFLLYEMEINIILFL